MSDKRKSPQPNNVSKRKNLFKSLSKVNISTGNNLLDKIAESLTTYKQENALALLQTRRKN